MICNMGTKILDTKLKWISLEFDSLVYDKYMICVFSKWDCVE